MCVTVCVCVCVCGGRVELGVPPGRQLLCVCVRMRVCVFVRKGRALLPVLRPIRGGGDGACVSGGAKGLLTSVKV